MKRGRQLVLSISLTLPLLSGMRLNAQSGGSGSPSVSDEQKAARSTAEKDFKESRWNDAFNEFKALHEESPNDATITEFLAESSLNAGKLDYAHELLDPLVKSAPNRWRALGLLTRYYAETNNDSARNKGLAELQEMHDSGRYARLSAQDTILLERHTTADRGSVGIWYSLKPWGRFKAYLYARYSDKDGHETSYMTLESSDMDQALWAKQHPAEAAAGGRMFSLDFYRVPVKNPDGTSTGFHATMGFFDGRPPYDQIRDRMISTASKPPGAISSLETHGQPPPAP